MTVILIFKCTEGTGVGEDGSPKRKALDLDDLRRIEDCEQSRAVVLPESFQNLKCFKAQEKGKVLDTFG